MTLTNRVAGFVLAAAATAALAWGSQVPVRSGEAGNALLRLAWRARPERIEQCVTQSAEALAALPPHMRQTTICEGINASYRLEVYRDGLLVAGQQVEPGGLRRDRPLYVFHEVRLPAGASTIRVTFTRVEQAALNDDRGDDDDEPDDGRGRRDVMREALPEALVWEEHLAFASDQIRVISYDPARRTLFEVSPE